MTSESHSQANTFSPRVPTCKTALKALFDYVCSTLNDAVLSQHDIREYLSEYYYPSLFFNTGISKTYVWAYILLHYCKKSIDFPHLTSVCAHSRLKVARL